MKEIVEIVKMADRPRCHASVHFIKKIPVKTFCLSVLIGLTLFQATPSLALSFFSRKKPPTESLPPETQISPQLMPQKNQSDPGMKPPVAPPPGNIKPSPQSGRDVSPSSDSPPMAFPLPVPPNLVQQLVEQKIFPSDASQRTEPLTRAELAVILVKALRHNTQLLEEFPFYRDVSRDNPDYAAIEVARAKKLLTYPDDHGFYYPEKQITYANVYQGISQAITGPSPAPELTEHLLQAFEDKDVLSPELTAAVAKMAQVRFFTEEAGQAKSALNPDERVTLEGLAPYIIYLRRVIEQRANLDKRRDQTTPALPSGLTLTLSPSTALLEAQMLPGQAVSFSLVNPVDPLPKGSHLQGIVNEVQPPHTFILNLNEAHTPDGTLYQLKAPLTLVFPARRRAALFLPGQNFEVTTEAVPISEQPSGTNRRTPSAMPPNSSIPVLLSPANSNNTPRLKPPSQ